MVERILPPYDPQRRLLIQSLLGELLFLSFFPNRLHIPQPENLPTGGWHHIDREHGLHGETIYACQINLSIDPQTPLITVAHERGIDRFKLHLDNPPPARYQTAYFPEEGLGFEGSGIINQLIGDSNGGVYILGKKANWQTKALYFPPEEDQPIDLGLNYQQQSPLPPLAATEGGKLYLLPHLDSPDLLIATPPSGDNTTSAWEKISLPPEIRNDDIYAICALPDGTLAVGSRIATNPRKQYGLWTLRPEPAAATIEATPLGPYQGLSVTTIDYFQSPAGDTRNPSEQELVVGVKPEAYSNKPGWLDVLKLTDPTAEPRHLQPPDSLGIDRFTKIAAINPQTIAAIWQNSNGAERWIIYADLNTGRFELPNFKKYAYSLATKQGIQLVGTSDGLWFNSSGSVED